jgi:hypothetical protein
MFHGRPRRIHECFQGLLVDWLSGLEHGGALFLVTVVLVTVCLVTVRLVRVAETPQAPCT